jgi:hypothetical protein
MELPMIKQMTLAAALLAVGAVASPQMSSAASFSPVPGINTGDTNLVETVQWRGRCRAWRHECGRRWGWGGWRYRRCLARHGCL